MKFFDHIRAAAVAAVALALVALPVSASPLNPYGSGVNVLTPGSVFTATYYVSTGDVPGPTTIPAFEFYAPVDIGSISTAITLPATATTVKDLTLQWFSDAGLSTALAPAVAFTNSFGQVITPFAAMFQSFTSGQTAFLGVSWSGVNAEDVGVPLRVSAVPLPAGVFLLGSGLAGLGLLSFRKKSKSKAVAA